MKKLFFALALVAAGAAYCGGSSPAVTAKQMTNYVAEVETRVNGRIGVVSNYVDTTAAATGQRLVALSNYVERVSSAGLSNYVHKATEEMQASVDNALDKLAEGLEAASNAVDYAEQVAQETTNAYREVKQELVGVSNFVSTVSPAGLSNYVRQVEHNINQSLIGGLTQDDELHFDENGAYTKKVMLWGGVVTNVEQRYSVDNLSQIGDHWGYEITKVEGAMPDGKVPFAVGNLLAVGPYTNNYDMCYIISTNQVFYRWGWGGSTPPLFALSYNYETVGSIYGAYYKLGWENQQEQGIGRYDWTSVNLDDKTRCTALNCATRVQ